MFFVEKPYEKTPKKKPWDSDLPKPPFQPKPNSTLPDSQVPLSWDTLPKSINGSRPVNQVPRVGLCGMRNWVRSLAGKPATNPGVSLELSESVNFTYAGTVWTATWKLFWSGFLKTWRLPRGRLKLWGYQFEIHLKDPSGPNFVSSIVKGNIKADEFQTFLWVLNVLWNHASLLWPRAKPSTSRKKKINQIQQSADHLDLDFTWVGIWGNLSGNVNQWIISYLRKKRYVSYSSTSVTIRRPIKNQLFGTTVTCQLVQRKWRVARCLQVIELASNFALRPLCHEILLMEKNPANQLRLVVYPIIYRALAPSKRWLGMGFRPSTVSQTTVSLRLVQMPTSSGTRGPTTPWPTRNLMMLRTRFLQIRKHGWNTEPQNVGRNCSDAMVLFVVCISIG